MNSNAGGKSALGDGLGVVNGGTMDEETEAALMRAGAQIQDLQRRAFETLDCRTCRNFRGTAHCHSALRCVAGSSYQKTAPIQLWEEAPPADPGF